MPEIVWTQSGIELYKFCLKLHWLHNPQGPPLIRQHTANLILTNFTHPPSRIIRHSPLPSSTQYCNGKSNITPKVYPGLFLINSWKTALPACWHRMPESEVTLDGRYKVTAPRGMDPMDGSEPEIGSDQLLRSPLPWSRPPRSPWSHHPRSPRILAVLASHQLCGLYHLISLKSTSLLDLNITIPYQAWYLSILITINFTHKHSVIKYQYLMFIECVFS